MYTHLLIYSYISYLHLYELMYNYIHAHPCTYIDTFLCVNVFWETLIYMYARCI